MKASTWLAEYLWRQGIRHAFVPSGPGYGENFRALRLAGIETDHTHNVGVAISAAATLGELTAVPGLCVAGELRDDYLLASLVGAFNDRAPLLLLTGESEAERWIPLARLEPLSAPNSGTAIKSSCRLTAENVRAELPAAFDLSIEDPAGPVRLVFPHSEALREVGDCNSFILAGSEVAGDADDSAISRAVRRVAEARTPLIFVGLGVRELEAERQLVAAAERLGAPVVLTPKAKGHFPADHPFFAGVYPAYQDEPVKALFRQADVVLGIGLDPVEMIEPWPFATQVVNFGPVEGSACFPGCVDVRVTSYTALARALLALEVPSGWPKDAVASARRQIQHLFDPDLSIERREGVAPQSVIEMLDVLRRSLRRDAIVACDGGSIGHVAAQAWPSYWPRTFLTTTGPSPLGFGLSAALAAKVACPDRQVVCLTSEPGLLSVLSDLETFVRLSLPILVVVWRSGGSPSAEQAGKSARYLAPQDAASGAVDFAAYARSLGYFSATLGERDDCASAIRAALAQPGPALIQVEHADRRSHAV